MDKSKITVIIPVYNTQEYVEESVRSILGQSLKEIDVVVVNDGSTDNSLAILERLSTEDSRVRIISQVNGGIGVARNSGFAIAHGEYIYFMDSDDILRSDALERCYEKCKSENLDFIFFDALNFDDINRVFAEDYYLRTSRLVDEICDGCQAMNHLLDINGYRSSACLNVVNRKFMTDNNLMFREMRVHEDEIFTVELFCCAQRVGFIREPFFNRRVRVNSTMTTKVSMRNAKAYLYIADELQKYANNNSEIKHTVERYVTRLLNAAVRKFYNLTLKEKLYIARIYTFKHIKYFNIRTLLILFFK